MLNEFSCDVVFFFKFAGMVKLVSTILSVYFLVLTVMPCADAQLISIGEELSSVHDEADHSGHDHSSGEDLCSPFCVCQCCHTDVVNFEKVEFTAAEIELTSTVPLFKGRLLSPFPKSLLQPPRA